MSDELREHARAAHREANAQLIDDESLTSTQKLKAEIVARGLQASYEGLALVGKGVLVWAMVDVGGVDTTGARMLTPSCCAPCRAAMHRELTALLRQLERNMAKFGDPIPGESPL